MTDVPGWFCKLMLWAAEAFPNARPREGTYRAYYAVLGDLTPEQTRAAFLHAMRESGTDFFPSAPKVRSYAVPSADDAGLLAWMGLHQAAQAVGVYQPLDCADGAVAEAVRMVFGGWPAFCEQCQDHASGAWLAKRQEWLAAYRTARRERTTTGPARLPGLLGDGSEPQGWVGRLSASGEVESVRAQTLLPMSEGAPLRFDVIQLTTGDVVDEDFP